MCVCKYESNKQWILDYDQNRYYITMTDISFSFSYLIYYRDFSQKKTENDQNTLSPKSNLQLHTKKKKKNMNWEETCL